MTVSQTRTSSSLTAQLDLVEVKPGVRFSRAVLMALLPDVETMLFFGKVYELDHVQLSALLAMRGTDLTNALFGEGAEHSNELQDYIIDICDQVDYLDAENATFDPDVPKGEILPQVWESLQVEVAKSIKAVAEKLESVVSMLPGKQGQMLFNSMMVMNSKRPVIGDYKARIHHAPVKENLVILDVSASMSEHTIRRIIDDVVALSYKANAHMAVVSNTTSYWTPGSYSVDDVLEKCEFSGTHYETLCPLFDRDWGTVITVADYDSSPDAKRQVATCTGRIELLLDISLVSRPTFLAACVGQLADEVRPLLVGNSSQVLAY